MATIGKETDGMRLAGFGPLTPREAESVLWVAAGKTAWEAGQILQVTEHTLSAHARAAATKLGASNRAHLVARAFVRGILEPIRMILMVIVVQALAGSHPSLTMRKPPRPTSSIQLRVRRPRVEKPAIWPDK